ncbi:hypothetical protein DL771_003141 [Monosporascus sp. 5C6A]|nr:hypothetical protein DL771_003141 [Monosporascus sp. 5C6A]
MQRIVILSQPPITFSATAASILADATTLQGQVGAEQRIKGFVSECGAREDVFRLVDAVYQRLKDDSALGPECRKLLTEERQRYVRNELMLSDAESEPSRLATIRERICAIESQFFWTLDEENLYVWLTREELKGVPEDVLSCLDVGSAQFEGKLRLPLSGPEFSRKTGSTLLAR